MCSTSKSFLAGAPPTLRSPLLASANERPSSRERGQTPSESSFTSRYRPTESTTDLYLPSRVPRTPVTFCETFPPDHFPIYFYRAPKAPDLEVDANELDLDAIRDARLFWVTVSGLSVEPSRTATMAALSARARAHPTVLDLDYRPSFWTTPDAARAASRAALEHVTVGVGNLSEVEIAVASGDPDVAADRLLDLGLSVAVIKLGPEGVLAKTEHERVLSMPVAVHVVNGLGAGDAFGGALCHGILAGWPLSDVIHFANAAGAIVASRLGCSEAMPTTEEIEDLLEGTRGA